MTQLFKNNASGRLSGAHNSSVLTINMVDSSVFPVPAADEWYLVTMYKVTNGVESDFEIIKVTANDTGTDQITVVRNQEGSGAKAYVDGDYIELRLTAGTVIDATPQRIAFTPVVRGSTIPGTPSGTFQGYYVKVGAMVFIELNITITAIGGMTGILEIDLSDIPHLFHYTPSGQYQSIIAVGLSGLTSGDNTGARVGSIGNHITISVVDPAVDSGVGSLLITNLNVTTYIRGLISFMAIT